MGPVGVTAHSGHTCPGQTWIFGVGQTKLRRTATWAGITATALPGDDGVRPGERAAGPEAVDRTGTLMAAPAKATRPARSWPHRRGRPGRTAKPGPAEVGMNVGRGDGTVTLEGACSWGDGYAYGIDPLASGPYRGKE